MARPKENPLISYLLSLVERDDRAALAALRGALRSDKELDALRFVAPFVWDKDLDNRPLGAKARRRAEDDAILVASLFAFHPEQGSGSLAQALRGVFIETQSESIEGRFRALMSADREDLPIHLRHAVSLAKAKGRAIDWDDLYAAIRYWDQEENRVRRQWARDFWVGQEADVSE